MVLSCQIHAGLRHYAASKLPENIYNNLGLKFPDLPDSCPMAMMNRQILPYLARAVRFCLGIHLRDPEIRFEI